MPPVALLRFANDIKKAPEAPDFRKHVLDQYKHSAPLMSSGGVTTEPTKMKEIKKK